MRSIERTNGRTDGRRRWHRPMMIGATTRWFDFTTNRTCARRRKINYFRCCCGALRKLRRLIIQEFFNSIGDFAILLLFIIIWLPAQSVNMYFRWCTTCCKWRGRFARVDVRNKCFVVVTHHRTFDIQRASTQQLIQTSKSECRTYINISRQFSHESNILFDSIASP